MFTISADFFAKVANNGGILDTKNYRYALWTDSAEVERLPVKYLDTTAAHDSWETGSVRRAAKEEG